MRVLLSSGRYRLGLALCLALFVLNVWASEEDARPEVTPQAWLIKMSNALQRLNYEGVFIHLSDGQLSAMRLKHVVDARGEREYLLTLTGPERRVMRDGVGGHFGFTADDQGVAGHLSDAEKYYDLTLLGTDRIAGHLSQRLSVLPKDDYRYGYQLWLADTTGLLLRSDLINTQGDVIEQVMFTSMVVSPLDTTEGEIGETEKELEATTEQVDEVVVDSPWFVDHVPTGFVLASRQVHVDQGILHLIYTDGLASVSVFIEQSTRADNPFSGVSRRGAVSAFGRVVNGHQTTVVGEVPEVTVALIGRSIRLASK